MFACVWLCWRVQKAEVEIIGRKLTQSLSYLQFSWEIFNMKLCILLAVVAFVGLSLGEEKKEKDKELGTVIGIDLGTTYSW